MSRIGVPLRAVLVAALGAAGLVAGPVPALSAEPDGGLFAPTVSYRAGHYPFEIALGDFHGTGRLDLVAVNNDENSVSVFTARGDGSFGAPDTSPVGVSPSRIVTGDFSGDGRIDLAVATGGHPVSNVGAVELRLGNGDGTFQPSREFAAGAHPVGLATGDLNGDGRPDLVTANGNDGTVSVLLGNGDGTLRPQQIHRVGANPTDLVLVDLDRDGHLDIAVTDDGGFDAGAVFVLRGDGSGGFGPALGHPTGSTPLGLTAADLNGDGRPDLAVTSATADAVDILLGDGNGGLGTPTVVPMGDFPGSITTGDFDLDGRADLVATGTALDVAVLPGNGDGTFRPQQSYRVAAFGGRPVVGDLDGDGRPDLAVGNDAAVSVLLNTSRRPVTVTLTSTGDPAPFGSPVTFTATVCPAAPGIAPAGPPTGAVALTDGATPIGTGALSPGGGPNCALTRISRDGLLPGPHTVTARYPGDTAYRPGAPVSITQRVGCARTLTGQVGSVVATGPSTCLLDATADAVLVEPGATLFVGHSTLGSITARGAARLAVCDSTLTGSVAAADSAGSVLIGDPAGHGCLGNRITGSVQLSSNQGGSTVGANTVGGSLHCTGNAPPPGDGGAPNTVGGARTGQCARL
ncbi:FG-GAP-like repeat-containing protein [Kitasatospora sp. NPDC101801]|uniref:FG-GAP-like repeat-containing protein n=1 Tax=Kitasatospora sp. NPDC101801 TaxID=3364103 RepID=UPI0037F40EAA